MEVAMDALSSEYEFRVRWEPYLLRPQTPAEGFPIPPQYKDASNPRVKHLRDVAASLGLVFNPDRARFASTLKAHALLEYAKTVDNGDKQDALSDMLFKKCFTDGDLLQEETLLALAKEVGLDVDQVAEYIKITDNLENTYLKAIKWAEKGISGVPTFYFNGQKMFSGAQEPEVFKRMFEIAAERFPVENPASKS